MQWAPSASQLLQAWTGPNFGAPHELKGWLSVIACAWAAGGLDRCCHWLVSGDRTLPFSLFICSHRRRLNNTHDCSLVQVLHRQVSVLSETSQQLYPLCSEAHGLKKYVPQLVHNMFRARGIANDCCLLCKVFICISLQVVSHGSELPKLL